MEKSKIYKAQAAAQKIVRKNCQSGFPAQITSLLNYLKIPVYKYEENICFLQKHGFDKLMGTSGGLSVIVNGCPHIFYKSSMNEEEKQFTLAHELGHIVCGHLKPGVTETDEVQADAFAEYILTLLNTI